MLRIGGDEQLWDRITDPTANIAHLAKFKVGNPEDPRAWRGVFGVSVASTCVVVIPAPPPVAGFRRESTNPNIDDDRIGGVIDEAGDI